MSTDAGRIGGSIKGVRNRNSREYKKKKNRNKTDNKTTERVTYVHVLHLGIEVMKLLLENLGNVAGRAADTSLLHNMVHKTLNNTLHRMQRCRHRCDLVVDLLKGLGRRLWRLGGCTQRLELIVNVIERLNDAELGITNCLGDLRLRGQNNKEGSAGVPDLIKR